MASQALRGDGVAPVCRLGARRPQRCHVDGRNCIGPSAWAQPSGLDVSRMLALPWVPSSAGVTIGGLISPVAGSARPCAWWRLGVAVRGDHLPRAVGRMSPRASCRPEGGRPGCSSASGADGSVSAPGPPASTARPNTSTSSVANTHANAFTSPGEWRRGRTRCATFSTSRVHREPVALRLSGGEAGEEQERLLQLWRDALTAFCAERGPVARVRWTEWAAPTGLDEQLTYLDEHYSPNGSSAPVDSYRELLLRAGPMATRHEVLLTVTVEQRRTTRRRRSTADRETTAEEVLRDEIRLLTSRLETAGLIVDTCRSHPLSLRPSCERDSTPTAHPMRTPISRASPASLAW